MEVQIQGHEPSDENHHIESNFLHNLTAAIMPGALEYSVTAIQSKWSRETRTPEHHLEGGGWRFHNALQRERVIHNASQREFVIRSALKREYGVFHTECPSAAGTAGSQLGSGTQGCIDQSHFEGMHGSAVRSECFIKPAVPFQPRYIDSFDRQLQYAQERIQHAFADSFDRVLHSGLDDNSPIPLNVSTSVMNTSCYAEYDCGWSNDTFSASNAARQSQSVDENVVAHNNAQLDNIPPFEPVQVDFCQFCIVSLLFCH